MAKSKSEMVISVLEFLFDAVELLPRPLEAPYAHSRRLHKITYKEYYDAMYRLQKRGVVKIAKKADKNFITLTKKGALEILMGKAAMDHQEEWDGKWRMLVFDIPENAHLQRDRLRWLLKRNGFYKFQASVFVHPYPLNVEAIRYLQESGLSEYVRIFRADAVDNDRDLKKHFKL